MQLANPFPKQWRLIAASLVAAAIIIAMLATGMTASAESNNPQKAPVTGLSATPGSNPGEIDVSWDAHPADAKDYRLAWAPDGESFRRASNTDWNANPTATSMTITGLVGGSDYKVKVRARFDSNPRSRWSEIVTGNARAPAVPPTTTTPGPQAGRPAKPTGLSGAAADDAVTLTWDDPEDASITGYQVLRGMDADTLTIIAGDTGAADRQRVDEGLEAETEYTFAVKAINAAGTSEQSSPVVVTTLAAPELVLVKDADDEPPVSAQQEETCPGDGAAPTPVDVAVAAVPIVVESTTGDYFVLYVQHDLDADTTVDLPVLVKLGGAGTTTLAENVAALPAERYKVEKYLVTDPADVDGDCIDDITELGNPVGMNPVNPAGAIELTDGAVIIPNQSTFETLASGTFAKFVLFDLDTARPGVYFMNTEKYPDHFDFLDFVGLQLGQRGMIRGNMSYDRNLVAPDGSLVLQRRVVW